MKKTLLSSVVIFSSVSFALLSCGPKEIDPTTLPITQADRQLTAIPPACKSLYANLKSLPKVAVLDFENNTTFDAAKILQGQSHTQYKEATVGGAGVGVTPGGVGLVYGEATAGDIKTKMEAVSRDVNANLGQSVAEGVAATLVEMGGAKVYTRRDLKKVLTEQQFQQSGLVDEKTAIQLGKLAGVKYIVTGSVNNVKIEWFQADAAKEGLQQHLGLVGAVAAVAVEANEGWNITTDLTVKIIDVETGEVVFAKQVSGKENLGKVPNLNYDTIIGGIKSAAKDALEDAKEELSKYFKIRGYIIQTRTAPDKSQRFALINMGSKLGVQPGQEFYVYTFEEVVDPLTGKSDCDMIKLPVTLEATNQVQANKTWTIVNGETSQIMRIKPGQIVERVPLSAGLF